MGLSSSLPSKEAPEALAGSVPLVDSRLPPAVIGRCWRRCSAGAADGTADATDDGIGVGNTHSPSSGFVTVMNFNVLADAYCTPRAHPCAKKYRKWRFRRWKILREIETHACDFVCLQEVERVSFRWLLKQLSGQHYGGEWACTGKIGPALLFRTDRWVRKRRKELPLCSLDAKAYVTGLVSPAGDGAPAPLAKNSRPYWTMRRLEGQHHVALVGSFQRITSDGGTDASPPGGADAGSGAVTAAPVDGLVHVVATHFHWAPSDADIKTLQAGLLLHSLHRYLQDGGDITPAGECLGPVIVCGDYNSVPRTTLEVHDGVERVNGVYELFTRGSLNEANIRKLFAARCKGDCPEVLPPEVDVLTRIKSKFNGNFASAMATAVGSEPQFTNYTRNFKDCLDYVFYLDQSGGGGDTSTHPSGGDESKSDEAKGGSVGSSLTPVAVLEAPPEAVLAEEEAIPSSVFPSDHIPLVVVFRRG